MFKKTIALATILLNSCGVVSVEGGGERYATCELVDFKGFPKKVTGPVTLELKNFITIMVWSKDGRETIEITFKRKMCKYR